MKRAIMPLWAMLLTIGLITPVMAQEPQEGPLSAVVAGSGWTTTKFENWKAGFRLGFQTTIDADRGLSLRTLYNQMSFGPGEDITAMEITALEDWVLGKRWSIYFLVGTQNYLSGANQNTDWLGGIGFSKLLFLVDNQDWLVPGSVTAFVDIHFTDADGNVTGSYAQLNFGLKIGKPSGKKPK